MSADGSAEPAAVPPSGDTFTGWWQQADRSSGWGIPAGQPTQPIRHRPELVRPLLAGPAFDITTAALTRSDGIEATSGEVLAAGYTDALLVVHDGRLVHEWYSPDGGPDRPHITMSITKSVVGAVAGVLIGRGQLSADTPLTALIPEMRGTGYDGATVRDVLDMRSGAAFREEYSNPEAEVNQLDDWVGPSGRGLYPFLATLHADQSHGGPFRYRSGESDVLGWACERAADTPMAQLISQLIWAPMGAEHDAQILTDAGGTAIHDGGLCATARDLARFGQLLCDGGAAPDPQDGMRPVIPPAWLRDSYAVDVSGRQAFTASNAETSFPGGWYRNQMWFRPSPYGDVLLCLGIFGQMIHINRATRTVAVKLSSWPTAQLPRMLIDTVRAFDAIGGQLRASVRAAGSSGVGGVVSGGSRRGLASRADGSGAGGSRSSGSRSTGSRSGGKPT